MQPYRNLMVALLIGVAVSAMARPGAAQEQFQPKPPSAAAFGGGAPGSLIDYSLVDAAQLALGDHTIRLSVDGLRPDAGATQPFATLRATYRYTWLERLSWSAQIGLSSRLDDAQSAHALPVGMRLNNVAGNASAPRLHLAAGGQFFEGLGWAIETDSLLRRRGAAVDLDLRVNYSLSHTLRLFGGFRWNDSPEEEFLSSSVARTGPTVGVRYRF